MEALALVFEVVAELYLVHGVVLVAFLADGLAAVPAVIADIEGGRRIGLTCLLPTATLADQAVEVCEGGVGLYLEFDGEVFYLGADGGDGV